MAKEKNLSIIVNDSTMLCLTRQFNFIYRVRFNFGTIC